MITKAIIIILVLFISVQMIDSDVCTDQRCACSKTLTEVKCDTKEWTNLTGIDFPAKVKLLSLVGNKLDFSLGSDLDKINNLSYLTDLNLNQNALREIPLFNNTNLRSLYLESNSLTSAKIPSIYKGSALKTISLNGNRILSIDEFDFSALHDTALASLYIDNAFITKIDGNAFDPLRSLQSLSLVNNRLASCDFLPTMPQLSSIKLDGNVFTSIPQILTSPGKIKVYSFQRNQISIIDESSPLNTWSQKNYTNMKIYLTNNTFDCCLSLWLIRFLKTSSRFIPDASSLQCTNPKEYTGKKLTELNPDTMNCGGSQPSQSWWTTARIITVTLGTIAVGVVTVIIAAFVVRVIIRQNQPRSGYTEIDGINDSAPNPTALIFPPFGIDDDDQSVYSTAANTTGSRVTSQPTADGISAVDESQIGGSEVYESVSNLGRINI